jgi:hypothetical protein
MQVKPCPPQGQEGIRWGAQAPEYGMAFSPQTSFDKLRMQIINHGAQNKKMHGELEASRSLVVSTIELERLCKNRN